MEELVEVKKVSCPCCSQRLFDLDPKMDELIVIKCPRCKEMLQIKVRKKQIYARIIQLNK